MNCSVRIVSLGLISFENKQLQIERVLKRLDSWVGNYDMLTSKQRIGSARERHVDSNCSNKSYSCSRIHKH